MHCLCVALFVDVADRLTRRNALRLPRPPLPRPKDVGKPKAEVAAARIMERVGGVTVVPHFCRIEDKPVDWYRDFHVIALGLDSLEVRARASHGPRLSTGGDASCSTVSQARNYINGVVCSFLGACTCDNVCDCKALTPALCWTEFEEDGSPDLATIKPMVDGGTEGFKARGDALAGRGSWCQRLRIRHLTRALHSRRATPE